MLKTYRPLELINNAKVPTVMRGLDTQISEEQYDIYISI